MLHNMAWHGILIIGQGATERAFPPLEYSVPNRTQGGSGWGNLNPAGDASVGEGAALGGSKSEVDMDFSAREDEYGYGE